MTTHHHTLGAFTLLTLQCLPVLPQVTDEHGRGVPVGFMISSCDTTEVLEKFFRALQEGVSCMWRCAR